jgi:hypothetical protein
MGSGNGTFHYAININNGVTGTLTLWNINGNAKINGFGNNGELNLSLLAVNGLVNGFYNLATGRYIAEVRLTNLQGNIAFRREVIEIWQNTTTAFSFNPLVFSDPSAILPNSKAVLCETTSVVGGSIIGIGSGSGLNENDPKTYSCYQVNRLINLIFEQDSLFSTISWVNNTGSAPGGVFPNIGHSFAGIDFSTGNVLWVKAVSEDNSETMYYKFIIVPPVNYGDFYVNSTDLSGISYADGILTINTNGSYTIGMRSGVTSTTTDRIVVASGVTANITLSGVNINMGSLSNDSPFDMTGAIVNLTLVGNNILRSSGNRAGLEVPEGATLDISGSGSLDATGGGSGASIGGSSGGAGGNITISGGTVTANSFWGAGIGGGVGGAGGNITISGGTVTATGGQRGAGIGGGDGGAGGTISITGGTITAESWSSGAGVGGGRDGAGGTISITGGMVTANSIGGAGGTITTISGNAVIFASSIQPALPTGVNMRAAIIFIGNNGTMYGNVTLQQNITIPTGRILTISSGQILTIPSDRTLTNNGAIIIENGGSIRGIVSGNLPVAGNSLTISGGSAYTYTRGVLTITGNGTYTIDKRSGVSTTAERIVVSPGVTANITLNVNIDLSSSGVVGSAFDMTGATVNLTLVGNNVLRSSGNRAGLEVPAGATLDISGSGSLDATGGGGAAGIGGGSSGAGGTISISGGTVTATGSSSGAGIGGGGGGAGGTISISGGTVTATGGHSGAGIGGGNGGSGGTINTISGNAVVFASSIQPELPTGVNLGPAIIFIGNNGTMYGNVTLARNVTIPTARILPISTGQSLTIPSGITLTNNGTINNSGTIIRFGVIAGTGSITGNQPVP